MSETSTNTTPEQVKKKKRIFMWFFLAVQALFIFWIIAGLSDSSTTCEAGDQLCKDAEAVGTGIGLFLVVGLWMAVDFLLAVGYVIYRLAKRPS